MEWIFDWLRTRIKEESANGFGTNGAFFSYLPTVTAEKIINEAEAKWEAEVVRCKDCKYWEDVDTNWCTEHVKFCNIGTYAVGKNGYCVYGERKPIKIREVE